MSVDCIVILSILTAGNICYRCGKHTGLGPAVWTYEDIPDHRSTDQIAHREISRSLCTTNRLTRGSVEPV